jgi:FkbM family methyltransferase
MSQSSPLSRLYGYAKSRYQHRRIYRSGLDLVKAFYLRATTPDRPVDQPPRFIPGLRLQLNGLPDPLYLRSANSDFLVFNEIFENGEYQPIRQWNLPADATIFDLGGNIGLASVYFGSILPKSRIMVVEPDADNCRIIRQNNQGMIQAGRLRIVEAFVAATDGTAGIDRNARSWAFKMVDESAPNGDNGNREQIRCLSVPSLMTESGFDRIDLLKCDIEGAEANLFAHCRDWIGQVSHLIVEAHAPYRNADLYQHLREADWEFDVLKELQEDKVGLCFLKGRRG